MRFRLLVRIQLVPHYVTSFTHTLLRVAGKWFPGKSHKLMIRIRSPGPHPIMNLEKAKKILEAEDHILPIEKILNRGPKQKRWRVRYHKFSVCDTYTDRELVRLARIYRHSNDKHALSKILKYYDRRKNRQLTRQKIHNRQFSDIPQSGPLYRENPWNWD